MRKMNKCPECGALKTQRAKFCIECRRKLGYGKAPKIDPKYLVRGNISVDAGRSVINAN